MFVKILPLKSSILPYPETDIQKNEIMSPMIHSRCRGVYLNVVMQNNKGIPQRLWAKNRRNRLAHVCYIYISLHA